MKIVNATWEKRNLDVDCIECTFNSTDSLSKTENLLKEIDGTQYLVMRVSSENIPVMQYLQSCGFLFIEAAIKLEHDLKDIAMPKRFEHIQEHVECEVFQKDDIEILYSEIDNNIFKSDRIYLDPYFTSEYAARRYKYWTMDLINDGIMPYKVRYKGEEIGFFLNKQISAGVFDGLLAGVYSAYEGTGMGVCIQYAGLKYAKGIGGKRYIGHVSANNPQVLKTLELLGFKIKLIEYVLIKHN